MARKSQEKVSELTGSNIPTLRSLALHEVRRMRDITRSSGMNRLLRLNAHDAATEYALLHNGSGRARARFGIQPDDDLAYESYILEEMRMKAKSNGTPANSPTRVPLRAPSKG